MLKINNITLSVSFPRWKKYIKLFPGVNGQFLDANKFEAKTETQLISCLFSFDDLIRPDRFIPAAALRA